MGSDKVNTEGYFEEKLYLVLHPNIDAKHFMTYCRDFIVFLVSDEGEPDKFGVFVGEYQQDVPELRDVQISQRFGIKDINNYRFTEDVTESEDGTLCLPLSSDTMPSLVEALKNVLKTFTLETGQTAIEVGYYRSTGGPVRPRVTHEVFEFNVQKGV